MALTINDIRAARERRDPRLAELIVTLVTQPDAPPNTPPRDDAPNIDTVLQRLRSDDFRRQTLEEQQTERQAAIAELEAEDAPSPLHHRFRLYDVILALHAGDSVYDRTTLLEVLRTVPFVWGPWKAVKSIYKQAEETEDWELFAVIAARLDRSFAGQDPAAMTDASSYQPTSRTLGYMVRRAWRTLRRLGETLPAVYPRAAAHVLAEYTESNPYAEAGFWIANHIYYHRSKKYGATKFKFGGPWNMPKKLTSQHAFPESWERSSAPLLMLLEEARADRARTFAAELFKAKFSSTLSDLPTSWVPRLVARSSEALDDFVVWLLENGPQFERGAFRSTPLHESVVRLFDSRSASARKYAVAYGRTYVRDLPVATLVGLAQSDEKEVRKFAEELLGERDPRKDVGLTAWSELLRSESRPAQEYASKVIAEHFGASDLSLDWFLEHLTSPSGAAFEFASTHLSKVHASKAIPTTFYLDGLDRLTLREDSVHRPLGWFWSRLRKEKLSDVDSGRWVPLFLHSEIGPTLHSGLSVGDLKPSDVGIDFLKALAFEPDFQSNPQIQSLKSDGPAWAKSIAFLDFVSEHLLQMFRDVREYSPSDLGFDWLLRLVRRSEPRYHSFAEEVLIRAFAPADFAPSEGEAEAESTPDPSAAPVVDLNGQSFLFTGKLATMTRKEAQEKVKSAGGKSSSSVNAKLDYLVIGDEGSPLYGEGKKGSKQVAAEKLIEGGSELKIISETAFLRMLQGEELTHSADATQAGCEVLWAMAIPDEDIDGPEARFARSYLKQHHPEMALAINERPVDPGAEVPADFLTFERFEPLLHDKRGVARQFALAFAEYEFARWSPSSSALVKLCESEHNDVRAFVTRAILVTDEPEHRRFRIGSDAFTLDDVYAFCESRTASTRALGMELIARNQRFRDPQSLFRLTESPDRRVREFVIRTIWQAYHARSVTHGWTPSLPPLPELGAKTRAKVEARIAELGTGPEARPDELPASLTELRTLLRRVLFRLPPGPPPSSTEAIADIELELTTEPAREAKRHLMEVTRDLAVEDADFAALVLPLFDEFTWSKGQSEMRAALVAATRIRAAHADLVEST